MRINRHAARLVGAIALGLFVPLLAVPSAGAEPVPANTDVNPRPAVVPALQQWEGGTGSFELRKHSRIVLAKKQADELDDQGAQLSAEIEEATGHKPAVSPRVPQDGDIVLSIDPSLADATGGARFAEEGYTLTATDRNVTITAPTAKGVYYGTRSLLQILLLDDGRDSVPVGTAVDWPNYKVRGFMLDVGRRFFTADYIRDYLRVMGWFKLNQLQLHLNDNGFKGDKPWSEVQAGFRLKTDNPELGGLASQDGSYDRADWDSFEDTAAANGVTIIPEIDAPAHSLAFIRFRPSLGLNNGQSDHLDLSKPETTAFMKSVFDEFVPWFRSPDVHFGADEYTVDKPRYKVYFNEMAAHIRALGKQPRAWGSLSVMAANSDGYDRDVTMNSWNNGWYGPQALKRDGYSFINTNDALLYIVPFAGYYHGHGLDGKYLYDQWEPNVFPGGQSVAPRDPQLLGAMSAVWNDLTEATYSELDVHGLVEPTFGTLAQKMWSGAKADMPYSAFLDTVRKLGVGTGLTKVSTTLAASASGEVSLGKEATASAGEAAAAFDGVRTTNWASGPGDEAWLQVNLGKPVAISKVELDWAPDYGRDYEFQVSRDGEKWTTVASRTGREAAGSDTLTFDPVTARHVRLVGTQAGKKQNGYALWSMRVFEVPDLALHRPTTASSTEVASLGPENATDGDGKTRWASAYRDDEWIQVDLGSPQTVQRVLLDWENASGRDYDIQVSGDAANWKTVASVRGKPSGARVDELTFDPVTARYVRMQGIKRTTGWGYSLWRLEVRSMSPEPDPA
ncbi:discoidin domain-containing protein (plasmid) [Streptomyces sp. NBC_00841]|uniref:discoidin domain-containing protein n=1 Tax=unclassified Streptomyces TaxID=2593676 RepID=UPI002258C5D8|nr:MULTISPECIES: discoidin domain-containing protein [unclassified Streptomyces]MCX4538796.1 discoidin domain-containing protein [Streptomyces sp. NBC_01669]WSA05404.1 discoidin domain-containing protein [Streptomyces sp. NBC_00841]